MTLRRVLLRIVVVVICVFSVAPPIVAQDAQDALPEPLAFLPQGGRAYLSPDGLHIAHTDGQTLCVYAITGGTPVCGVTNAPVPPDRSSVRWSPDSTRLAFAEDFPIRLIDADIWVMDAATGTLHDLTDDGVTGRIPIAEQTLRGPLDVSPQWSADGTQLTFVRYTRPDPQFVATLCTVPAAGGPVVERERLPNIALDIFALALSPDGTRLAFGTGTDTNDQNAGVWVAGGDGTGARRLVERLIPAQVAFSPDGGRVLTFNMSMFSNFAPTWDTSSNRVFAADGNGDGPVDRDHAAHWAGWSPRGDALVYVVRNGLMNFRLDNEIAGVYVVPHPGERGVRVVRGAFTGPMPGTYGQRGLTWAANNTTLVRDVQSGSFALVRLPPTP